MKCTKCSKDKPTADFYVKNDGRKYRWCKTCLAGYSTKRHQALKQRAVDYMGGQCKLCGYQDCNSALVFHHLDPNQKDFGIASMVRKWKTVQKELDKCVMLCQNCHCEVHAGVRSV